MVRPVRAAEALRLLSGPAWYRHAVFQEVYVRSLQDSDGDGVGDLPVMPSRLADSEYDVFGADVAPDRDGQARMRHGRGLGENPVSSG